MCIRDRLYTALIAFIWYEGDEEEKNLNTLLDLLNESETREAVSYTHLDVYKRQV